MHLDLGYFEMPMFYNYRLLYFQANNKKPTNSACNSSSGIAIHSDPFDILEKWLLWVGVYNRVIQLS